MARASVTPDRVEKLSAALEGAKTLLIVVQNNPDPDAIAAAAALREIANQRLGIACTVAYAGTVGRAENQALLRYLGLPTRPLNGLELNRFDRIAMVDAQPGAGNVAFDPSVRLDIVIDHHPIRRETRSARYTDIRSRYGATSTILYEYLTEGGVEIPPKLATAMVYGIRSDTQELGRESTRADLEAYVALYPAANSRALGRIVSAPLPRSYFTALRNALDAARIYGNRVVSYLGRLENQEMIAEAADLLLRVEGVSWSVCLGVVGDWLHASLRASDSELNAGHVARRLAGRHGYGGGHHTLAAVQIPLSPEDSDGAPLERRIARMIARFLRATGSWREEGEPLCNGGPPD